MPDSQYLSIGEVLGLLLEDFPDVTISKIRFLESQGLIEPERTPSGYRKFYDHDVDLLRAILHEQRENFLPLKVIRDRIESGGIQADATGGRTPPRGIRNVEIRTDPGAAAGPAPTSDPAVSSVGASSVAMQRDSVFRRTDGGPEWADGRALIPGTRPAGAPSSPPITAAVPVTPMAPRPAAEPATIEPAAPIVAALDELSSQETAPTAPAEAGDNAPADDSTADTETASVDEPDRAIDEPAEEAAAPEAKSAPEPAPEPAAAVAATDATGPYNRDQFCAAAHITPAQLDELESFGLLAPRGSGRDASYPPESLEIATVAGRFLANGIDARHLRSWRQSADRESALFEQRIMPLLRQRNPVSRQLALDTLTELAALGSRLRDALIDAALRHHFEGT